jgi:hypothetical protein
MKTNKVIALVTGFSLLVTLGGCASAPFSANKDKSFELVKNLKDEFSIAGFAAQEVIEGSYNFETGGDPNASFMANIDPSISMQSACQLIDTYAQSISESELTFFPRSGVTESHAVVNCISDYLDEYSQGFRWNGTLSSGEPFKVILYSDPTPLLQVSTNFQDGGANEQDMGLEVIPQDSFVTNYLDGLQSYRTRNGITLFDSASLAAANLESTSAKIKITPVIDSDGLIRKIAVKVSGGGFNQCFSALPWDEKIWGVKDPGPSYPTYSLGALKDLNNFGSYISNSLCK